MGCSLKLEFPKPSRQPFSSTFHQISILIAYSESHGHSLSISGTNFDFWQYFFQLKSCVFSKSYENLKNQLNRFLWYAWKSRKIWPNTANRKKKAVRRRICARKWNLMKSRWERSILSFELTSWIACASIKPMKLHVGDSWCDKTLQISLP